MTQTTTTSTTTISDIDNLIEVEPVIMQSQFGSIGTKAIVDLGSVGTIINKILANPVIMNSKESYGTNPLTFQDLTTFSNELIKTVGVINTTVKCNDWIATNENVAVVEDGHRPINGRDLFPQLGLSITQSKQILNIEQNQCLIMKQIALYFPGLIFRIVKSHKHTDKSTFHKKFTPNHQKGRPVPINLQPIINAEFKKIDR